MPVARVRSISGPLAWKWLKESLFKTVIRMLNKASPLETFISMEVPKNISLENPFLSLLRGKVGNLVRVNNICWSKENKNKFSKERDYLFWRWISGRSRQEQSRVSIDDGDVISRSHSKEGNWSMKLLYQRECGWPPGGICTHLDSLCCLV